ncbi:MAG: CPBP family intramembrane glutamic endopeptidase [Chloroflexia bacterium]
MDRRAVLPAYLGAFAVAEVLGLVFGAAFGALLYALLLVLLLAHYIVGEQLPYRRMLPVLALLPLLRLLSLAMPVRQLPMIFWHALIGAPLLLAVWLAVRLLGLHPTDLGLRRASAWRQVLIAASGIPLSVAGYLVLRPQPPIPAFSLPWVSGGAVILFVFSGFVEELLFRGLLQRVAGEIFGRAALLYSAAAFVVLYTGSSSLGYLLLISLTGLFFGWCVERTGAIWGVTAAHGLMLAGMALLWPYTWLGSHTI